MKIYVYCPVCGTKLMRAAEGKDIEQPCRKCNEMLSINVTINGIDVKIIKQPDMQIAQIKPTETGAQPRA